VRVIVTASFVASSTCSPAGASAEECSRVREFVRFLPHIVSPARRFRPGMQLTRATRHGEDLA